MAKILGSDASGNTTVANRVVLNKHTASASGYIAIIRVYSVAAGNAKVAVYSDSAGSPATLLTSGSGACLANQWNDIAVTPVAVTNGTSYWIGIVGSADGVKTAATSGSVLGRIYRDYTYATYTFPSTFNTTGFSSSTTAYDAVYADGYSQTILTTASISNPSSTTRAYYGGTNSLPPASAGGFTTEGEFSTTQYTNASTNNSVTASYGASSSYNYPGMRLELQVPSNLQSGVTIPRLDFGIKGAADNGYSAWGWNFYIKNTNTNSWESITSTASSALTTLTGSKTANISNYIDANWRISLLIEGNTVFDGNGSVSTVYVDYAYITLTHTDPPAGASFTPKIFWL